MTQPTAAEIKAALATLQRLQTKKYRRAELEAMSPTEVAAVLAEQPDAFDAIEAASND